MGNVKSLVEQGLIPVKPVGCLSSAYRPVDKSTDQVQDFDLSPVDSMLYGHIIDIDPNNVHRDMARVRATMNSWQEGITGKNYVQRYGKFLLDSSRDVIKPEVSFNQFKREDEKLVRATANFLNDILAKYDPLYGIFSDENTDPDAYFAARLVEFRPYPNMPFNYDLAVENQEAEIIAVPPNSPFRKVTVTAPTSRRAKYNTLEHIIF